jgi:hypothetical protein
MFCLLYSTSIAKHKIVKFHAQKQIGKSHVIDIFTCEDGKYLTLHFLVSHSLQNNKRIYECFYLNMAPTKYFLF